MQLADSQLLNGGSIFITITHSFAKDDDLGIALDQRAASNSRTVDAEALAVLVEALGVEPTYPSEAIRKMRSFVEYVAADGRATHRKRHFEIPPGYEDYSTRKVQSGRSSERNLISFTLTFTDDDALAIRLKDRASLNDRTVEQETLEVLIRALQAEPKYRSELVRKIRAVVDPIGGIELELPPRGGYVGGGKNPRDYTL